MARRFIVHVGAPKTGTSAFQEWAVANRAALLEAGYLYPGAGATAGGNHAALVAALGGAIADEVRTGHLIRLFEKEMSDHPEANVIVSSESMTPLRFMPHLRPLHRSLMKYADTATVVLVVRDQISYRNSCYAQTRQMMTPLPPFRDYIRIGKHGPRDGNWDFLERKYRGAGFGFEAVAFDRTTREIGIVAAMASLKCLAGIAVNEERREANPSVGDLALLVAEQVRFMIAGPQGELPVGLRPKLMPIVARHAARLPSASFNGYDQALADEARAAYRQSNDIFARRNFNCDWEELFPPTKVGAVSCQAVDDLDAPERRKVITASGRVLMDAIEANILEVSPRRP